MRNAQEEIMSEVIVITSGKGGVGKTTTTANVGTGLAQLNKKVVMIDTDIGLRNLDDVMGLENRIVYNLVDVIEGIYHTCVLYSSCFKNFSKHFTKARHFIMTGFKLNYFKLFRVFTAPQIANCH